ncbi:MAG: hypothetical protein RR444_06120 [Oscillospiraceae bacterium]
MRVLMLLIDGAQRGDYKGLSFVKDALEHGLVNNTPIGMETNSLTCIMNILGVFPQDIPTGRSFLEAVASGNEVSQNDLVFRCNGVSIEDMTLSSSCVCKELPVLNENVKIVPLGGYKNLLVIKNGRNYFDSIKTVPPHDHIGEDIKTLLPQSDNPQLQGFLRELIETHQLWPWGQAIKTEIPTFYELHKLTGAVVCKTEVVKGIAKEMDMFCPDIKHTTADTDTDLLEKSKVALELSRKYDLTVLHINGADEAAHRKDQAQKRKFIQKIDTEVVSFLLKNLSLETALIITSDHATDAKTGKHNNEPVDYYSFNKNKECKRWLKQL